MKKNAGFTLIELVIVIGIILMLFGFVTFNLVGVTKSTNISSASDILISDMAAQQTKAMSGIGSSSGSDYGIYFETNRYTLFKGNTYNSSDPGNFVVSMDNGYSLVNSFPNSTLVFSLITGEVINYQVGQASVQMQDAEGINTKTIIVNRYGVVVSQN